ncbi:Avirulence (Avh) protein [Phytophthora megakarya]|uniref:RxLR effector protein n=1 Tax=Phytophthora megakarya TaxID=4795 RepID=A0A225W599_9STRA|nr:Avirulence (Avh) protein [Phytophthora megakarya]
MRLTRVLALMAVLLAYLDSTVATERTKILAADILSSIGHKNTNPKRFLRVSEVEHVDSSTTADTDLVSEDRGFMDPLFARTAEILTKICNIGCRPKTVKDLDVWIQDMTIAWHRKAQLNLLYKDLFKHFKAIEARGWNPHNLKEKLNIPQKIETTSHSAQMLDHEYLLWLEFTKYWRQTHKVKQP